MSRLSISLFGNLRVRLDEEPRAESLPGRAQELLAYLVLHRRNHPREKVATLMWPRGSTERAKSYLRKALWQLRQSLDSADADGPPLLQVDDDWMRIHPEADVWVDATVFENAFDEVCDSSTAELTLAQIKGLKKAASLYTGDLLENWYREWCLRERARYKDMLLRVLDRLTRCCERQQWYDSGIEYGLRALRLDPARERIHRQLMRLRARAGDRTGALRQYERCVEVLDRELGVRSTTATRRLHERIRGVLLDAWTNATLLGDVSAEASESVREAQADVQASLRRAEQHLALHGRPSVIDVYNDAREEGRTTEEAVGDLLVEMRRDLGYSTFGIDNESLAALPATDPLTANGDGRQRQSVGAPRKNLSRGAGR